MHTFLTPPQAAKALSVCTKTLQRWEAAGRIQAYRTPGGHRRYKQEDITRLLSLPSQTN